MDPIEYRERKKRLDLAIFVKDYGSIKLRKEELEEYLANVQDLEEKTRTQAQGLLDKAARTLEEQEEELLEQQIQQHAATLKESHKKLSIRSKARNSHLKFMSGSLSLPASSSGRSVSPTKSSPTRGNTIQLDSLSVPSRPLNSSGGKRTGLHKSLHTIMDDFNQQLVNESVPSVSVTSPDQENKQEEEEEEAIPPEELEGRVLMMCLEKLTEPLNNDISVKIGKTVTKVCSRYSKPSEDSNLIPVKSLQRSVNNGMNKPTIHTEDNTWRYLVHWASHQGKRNSLEDRAFFLPYVNHLLNLPDNVPSVFFSSIFDGHNGELAAEYACDNLFVNIIRNENFFNGNYTSAIKEGFLKTNKNFCEKALAINDNSGTTATCALIIGDKLFVANVGDSTAILCSGKQSKPLLLTLEHKASSETEKDRIKESGGVVVWYHGFRVNGTIAVSRSIGDAQMQNLLIAEPHIFEKEITDDDDFVLLASDGLWDHLTPEQASSFIYDWLDKHPKVDHGTYSENIASALMAATSQTDNVTVLIIFLKETGRGVRLDKAITTFKQL